MKSFTELLKTKREYYGNTEAAIDFAYNEVETDLIEWLQSQIKSSESTAQEMIQELGDDGGCDENLAKAGAFQEVLNYINEKGISISEVKA